MSSYAWFLSSVCAAVPASALAQTARADGDVVVTAERTTRSLRDTATSVVVITGDDAEHLSGASSTYDLIERIPNLVANRQSNIAPAVRGVDGTGPAIAVNAFFAGTRPRLNFLVDGRTLSFNEAVYLDASIWDLQQMEVYRGPQSTLQGRNAVAGVIAIKTADPTFTWTGRARGIVGEDDLRQGSAAIGGPLIGESVAFRLSADYRREDSFIRLNPYAELPDPDRMKTMALRGKLLLQPERFPDLRSLLTVSYTDGYGPQTLSLRKPYDAKVIAAPRTPRFRTRATSFISDNTWQASDVVGLSAFLTYTDYRVDRYINVGNGNARIDTKEYSAEPRVRFGSAGSPLSGFLAGYVYHARQKEAIDLLGGGTYDDRTETKAVFGEATWQASPAWRLVVGARYETEDRDRVGGTRDITPIDYHRSFDAFLPRATLSFRASPATTVGATVGRGYNAGGAGVATNAPFPSFTYGKETVWNYEGFLRTAFGGLRLNGNVFFNDFTGLQLPFDVASNPAAPALVIRNADRATTYGAEVEARYRAMKGLDLFGSLGLLKTKIDRYDDRNIQGKELPRAPAFSFNAGLSANPFGGLDASFDVRYTDSYYSNAFNDARGKTKPYMASNAQLAYRFDAFRLFVSATNLFDEDAPILYSVATNPANDLATIVRSRRILGGVEARF